MESRGQLSLRHCVSVASIGHELEKDKFRFCLAPEYYDPSSTRILFRRVTGHAAEKRNDDDASPFPAAPSADRQSPVPGHGLTATTVTADVSDALPSVTDHSARMILIVLFQAVAMDALSLEQQLPPYPFFTQTTSQQQQQPQVASTLPQNTPLMQSSGLQRGTQLPPLSVTVPSTIPQSPPGSQTQPSMGIDINSCRSDSNWFENEKKSVSIDPSTRSWL
ncbi:hypothetical protein llap_13211 [Limosa lapponica baueri]|uniref:Uncharacterized protein n=1 Tax=Limosa lapponica baueri TaxID=1758121 RepID=A0A2I0TRP9_LIMLA|nr:hypothetical protein llap_13211 [Limosa lapponica baueri]